MAEHAACFLCASASEVETVAVVPPRHADGEPDTVALCPDCRERVRTLVEPLVARADALAATGPAPADGAGPGGESGADPAGADGTADPGAAPTDGDTTGEPGTDAERERPAGTDPDTDPAAAPDTGPDADPAAPRGYRTLLRFLRNRELPMPRAEVLALAARAYDVEERTVERALEHAVEQGRLTVTDGSVRRP